MGTVIRYRSSGRAGRGKAGPPWEVGSGGPRGGRAAGLGASLSGGRGYHRAAMAEPLSFRLEPAIPHPGDVEPMWPTPRPDPFDDPEWLFEPTWGGHRVLAFVGPSEVPGGGEARVVDAR